MAGEPRMTGLMLVDQAPDEGHLRLEWVFENSPGHNVNSLWFWDRRGLGTIRLLTPEDQQVVFWPERLGTDALEITESEWREVLATTRSATKVALLNQKKVAGNGNLYASEILHLCRISPELPANAPSRKPIRLLANCVTGILNDSLLYTTPSPRDRTRSQM